MKNTCVNFRNVGEFVNLLAEQELLRTKCLYRGGKITYLESLSQIETPKTIINLRRGQDPYFANIKTLQIATDNQLEVYDTSNNKVRRWLNEVIMCFQNGQIDFPVFTHCTSGKDRTGVIIAALLTLLDIPQDIIIEEYLLSEGETKCDWIEQALNGIGDTKKYFNKVCGSHYKKTVFSYLKKANAYLE